MTITPNKMLEAALGYAARGWAVFPCHPQTKQPLLKADIDRDTGEPIRGTGGLKKATTDPNVIASWWQRWPAASIGVLTGRILGAFVVDVDAGTDPATGELFSVQSILQSLEAEIGLALPTTWNCRTPRGGLHLYFAVMQDEMPGNRAAMLPRIDIRGDGGYVILPPSSRPDNRSYSWLVGPDDVPLAAAPAQLLDLVLRRGRWAGKAALAISGNITPEGHGLKSGGLRRRYALAAIDSELVALTGAVEGTRNDTLFHASIHLGQLVGAGSLDLSEVRAALESVVRRWPNLNKSLGTIESGLARGMKEPRDLNNIGAAPSRLGAVSKGHSGVGSESSLDRELAQLDMTDLGNALRFQKRNQNHLVSSEKAGWLCWDECRWSEEGADAAVVRGVHLMIQALKREADAIEDEP
jgi:putative DNA primase/helicase